MSTPTQKTEELETFIDGITPNPLGRRGSIAADVCTTCGKKTKVFKDALSKKEYTISGICQECQNSVFG